MQGSTANQWHCQNWNPPVYQSVPHHIPHAERARANIKEVGTPNKHGQQQVLDSGFCYDLEKNIPPITYIIKAVLTIASCAKTMHLKKD